MIKRDFVKQVETRVRQSALDYYTQRKDNPRLSRAKRDYARNFINGFIQEPPTDAGSVANAAHSRGRQHAKNLALLRQPKSKFHDTA